MANYEENEDQIWIVLTFTFNIFVIQTFSSEYFYNLSLVILVYMSNENIRVNIFLPKQAIGRTQKVL